jgi:hypothetical protein
MQRNILAWPLGMLSALAAAGVEGQGRLLTVDDFEDGDRRATSGLSWISIADDLMGGASTADLRVTSGGAGGGRFRMRDGTEIVASRTASQDLKRLVR